MPSQNQFTTWLLYPQTSIPQVSDTSHIHWLITELSLKLLIYHHCLESRYPDTQRDKPNFEMIWQTSFKAVGIYRKQNSAYNFWDFGGYAPSITFWLQIPFNLMLINVSIETPRHWTDCCQLCHCTDICTIINCVKCRFTETVCKLLMARI